ncbi:retrovirus-related pol polyprotein from transposon TNT 1-94, partial [Tanacetum coccineum]
EKVFVITALKNDLRKFKGKDIVNNAAQVSNATTIAPGMYKLDLVTLAPKDKNNRETHIYYLKHTMEQAAILREIVEQDKSLNPLDSASYSACKYVKLIQELLGYVRDTFPNIHKPSEKLFAVTPINKKQTVRHELCFLEFVSDMNARSKSKRNFTLVGNACPLTRITTTNEVPLREPIPLEVVAQEPVVTKIYTRRPKVPKTIGYNSKPKIAKSMISNKTEPDASWGSNTSVAPSSSSLIDCGLSKLFFAKIMGYGDYQIGNVTISRVYYVKGLEHHLFSVGQFCDLDLEVAFRKHAYFVRNLEGVDLLTGLVRGLPRPKFEKDHLCSAYGMGKSKKQSHKPKSEDTNQEKLYLLHMDLCGPMRVESVNGKKYILVIVYDYSRFTWVKFLKSKDEAPAFIIKFLKMIQVRLNTTVQNIRTDNQTEFVNQTLQDYYEEVVISHETSVARTPQQNSTYHGTIYVEFDELSAMASKQSSLEPALHKMTPATPSSGLVPNLPPSAPFVPPIRDAWDILFQPVFDELLNPPANVV